MSLTKVVTYVKPYLTSSIITGGVIGLFNMLNIKKSPKYHDSMTLVDYTRFSIFIGIKSFIYGFYSPISIFFILWDSIVDSKHFKTHFIPYSVYGK